MIKLPILDPVAGLFVSGLIMKAALELGWDSLRDLSDENVDARVLKAVSSVLDDMKAEGVLSFHRLRGRAMGPFLLMDVHISVDPTISVSAAHQISERARIRVRQRMPLISEFMVHVELGEMSERTVFEDFTEQQEDTKQSRSAEPQMLTSEHVVEVLREYDTMQAQKLAISKLAAGGGAGTGSGGAAVQPGGAESSSSAESDAKTAASAAAATASRTPAAGSFKSALASIVQHTTGKGEGEASADGSASGAAVDPRADEHDGPQANLDLSKLMRPQSLIERDVRRVLADPHSSFARHLLGVSHFTVHWLDKKLTVTLDLAFQPNLTIRQAQVLAHDIEKQILDNVKDVNKVDVHLELTPEHMQRAAEQALKPAPPSATTAAT
jgi:divalent metal cation (Fe/Co/Zn/Cd) transporter